MRVSPDGYSWWGQSTWNQWGWSDCGVYTAGTGGNGVESNGHAQEDYDSMEKDILVTKLKQVGFDCDSCCCITNMPSP